MEVIHLQQTPLLESLRRVAALEKSIDWNGIEPLLMNPPGHNLAASSCRIQEALSVIRSVQVRRAIKQGAKGISVEEGTEVAAIFRDEHDTFVSIMIDAVNRTEAMCRQQLTTEWEQFHQFATLNEPEWRRAAHTRASARLQREREIRLSEILSAMLNLEEDARQDKFAWFEEDCDWWAAIRFTEEEERQVAQRRAQRRDEDARASAAIRAASQAGNGRMGNAQQYPAYGAPSHSQAGFSYPPPQRQSTAPSLYPQYGYAAVPVSSSGSQASNPTNAAPAGYPAYGAATTPYASNRPGQSGYYDPYRQNNYGVVNGANQGNNFGVSYPYGGPPPGQMGQPPQRPTTNANQYTAPPANIFYGHK
jgi:hypothetical protein